MALKEATKDVTVEKPDPTKKNIRLNAPINQGILRSNTTMPVKTKVSVIKRNTF